MDAYRPTIVGLRSLGTLTAAALKDAWVAPCSGRIVEVHARVATAPTGATLLVDVNKNGTTIYGTQANRPTVAISGFTATVGENSVIEVAEDDIITIDVDQVGSTVAGANLAVSIVFIPHDFV